MGTPTSVNSNIPIGAISYLVIRLLTMMLVEVLISVIRTGEDRGKGQRHQELARAKLGPVGQANDDGEEKRGRGGVADKGRHHRRGDHHDEEDLVRAGAGLAQNHTPGKVGHARADQRLDHHQDAQYHDDGVARKPGECLFDGQQPRDGQKEQNAQRGHIGGDDL